MYVNFCIMPFSHWRQRSFPSVPTSFLSYWDGTCFWQKTQSKLPVALLVDKYEKATCKRMERKFVESFHEFTLDKESSSVKTATNSHLAFAFLSKNIFAVKSKLWDLIFVSDN